MTYISPALREQVIARAEGRCEYCLFHNNDTYFSHEIDHIVAEKHGGETVEQNLCLSCFDCNRHKGSDIASIDPQSGNVVRLYNPRRDQWAEHFRIDEEGLIVGLTAIGRVTARLLNMNSPEQVLERQALLALGRYPQTP